MKSGRGDTFEKFLEELGAGKIHPVYLFAGDEVYLIDQALRRLLEAVLPGPEREWNLDQVSVSEWEPERIITVAMTYPMAAQRRVVVVRDAETVTTSQARSWGQYLRKPSQTTVLIFLAPGARLTKNEPLKIFSKNARCFEFAKLYERQAIAWVSQCIQEEGRKIRAEAAQFLVQQVGPDLRALENEIQKLLLQAKEGDSIVKELVEDIVVGYRGFGFFDLQDAVGSQDLGRSLVILRRLLELGEKPTTIVSRLTTFFSALSRIQDHVQRHADDTMIAKELQFREPVARYLARKYRQFTINYSKPPERLSRVLEMLLRADLALKTTYQRSRGTLELMLYCLVQDVPADVLELPEVPA